MQMIAQPLLIYRLTGSPALLGLISLANALPTLLLSLYGGAIADRMRKKNLLAIGQVVTVVSSLGIAIALTTGFMSSQHPDSWLVLMAASVLQGIVMAFIMPARSAIIPELVSKGQVMNAVALENIGMNTFQLITPAVAGLLIDTIGFAGIYYILSGVNLFSIAFFTLIPVTDTIPASSRNTILDIKEGLKYVRSKTTILLILAFIAVSMLLVMPVQMLMPVFVDDILKVGATGMGLLMSLSGAGALVGSIILASLPSKRRGVILLTSSLFMSSALVAFAFSRSWTVSLGLMLLMGMGRAGNQTAAITLLQTISESEYLGRVMSILSMNMGLTSLGTFFAGILAESIGVQWAVGGFAMVLVLLSLWGLLFMTRIRKLD